MAVEKQTEKDKHRNNQLHAAKFVLSGDTSQGNFDTERSGMTPPARAFLEIAKEDGNTTSIEAIRKAETLHALNGTG